MAVSQQAVADALGLSRTTVTKILNRDPRYSAGEATRELVFRTAEKMGYDFTFIRRPFKREYGRTEINAACAIEIVSDGQVFDSGEAVARNVGAGGALLTHIRTTKHVLPLRRFTLRLRIRDLPALASVMAECQVVRVTDSLDANEPELGVKFIGLLPQDRQAIRDFVDRQLALREAAHRAALERAEAEARQKGRR